MAAASRRRVLLELGASVNQRKSSDGATALIVGAYLVHVKVMQHRTDMLK
jgi:hypothetical protein